MDVAIDSSFLSNRNFLAVSLVSTITVALVAGRYYIKNVYSYWNKKNIKGPEPYPIVGNFVTLLRSDRMKLDMEWRRNYGKIYGIYRGSEPILVVADPEVIQQICVKDFDAFQNHELMDSLNWVQERFLFFLQGEHWKRVRTLMSPTFTSGKIKKMFKFLDGCADDLVDSFDEQLRSNKGAKSSVINVSELYSLFTLDAIATCCYGLKLKRAGSSDLKVAASRDDFVKDAMKIFDANLVRLALIGTLPNSVLRLFGIKLAPMSQYKPLATKVEAIINSRRKSTKKFDDYLQLLVDAKLEDEMELGDMDLAENHHAGLTKESLLENQEKMSNEIKSKYGEKVTLTDLEVMSGGIFLLAVGLDTTSILLGHVTYTLAFHRVIQDKLYDEIAAIAEYNEDKTKYTFSYEALTSCIYLDAVLSETLRRIPPVLHIDRVAGRDYYLEKYDIHIPKDSKLFLSYYAVMNDPDYWEEPEHFNPDRFMPGNKEKIVPGSYCPFGLGPRHCIGMRFSLTEAKLALAKIIMRFRFEPAPGTDFPPEIGRNYGLNKLKKPFVKLLPREI